MLQIILWVLLAAVIGFLAVIFVRAAMFSPKPERKPSGEGDSARGKSNTGYG